MNDRPILVVLNLPHESSCKLFSLPFEDFKKYVIIQGRDSLTKRLKHVSLKYRSDVGFYIKSEIDYVPRLIQKLIRMFPQKGLPFFTRSGSLTCQVRARYSKLNLDISEICKQHNLLPPIKGDLKKMYGLYDKKVIIPNNSPYFEYLFN